MLCTSVCATGQWPALKKEGGGGGWTFAQSFEWAWYCLWLKDNLTDHTVLNTVIKYCY